MPYSPLWISPLLLALVFCGSGCGDSTSFFRVRNPFDQEAAAIADLKLRSEMKKQERAAGVHEASLPESSAPSPEPEAPSRPYFGTAEATQQSRLFGPKKAPTSEAAPAVAESEVPVPPPATPLSRKETVSQPRPSATGAVCYRCNGKGRYLTSLTPDGRMATCEDCGGSGRR